MAARYVTVNRVSWNENEEHPERSQGRIRFCIETGGPGLSTRYDYYNSPFFHTRTKPEVKAGQKFEITFEGHGEEIRVYGLENLGVRSARRESR